MTTPAEQAAEALRRARSKLGNAGQDVDYVDEALAALTAEAGRPYEWAMSRWKAEVANRPLQNIHRRSLDTTWRQVIRHYGGDDIALCGPPHGELIDDAESARVSPDREALARRLDGLAKTLMLDPNANWAANDVESAAAALRLPAQAEVEEMCERLSYSSDIACRDAMIMLRCLSSLPPAVGEWRPIASAPKDGTAIDLWADNRRWTSCRWGKHDAESEAAWGEPHWRHCYATSSPTHWMPLPPAPPQETKPT